jgi:hypothetical protein
MLQFPEGDIRFISSRKVHTISDVHTFFYSMAIEEHFLVFRQLESESLHLMPRLEVVESMTLSSIFFYNVVLS